MPPGLSIRTPSEPPEVFKHPQALERESSKRVHAGEAIYRLLTIQGLALAEAKQ